MSVGVMKDYKLKQWNLHASHTKKILFFFFSKETDNCQKKNSSKKNGF